MRKVAVGCVIGVAVWAAQVAVGEDWPRFRGAGGDGISTETGINKTWSQQKPAVLWKVALEDNGYAGASVAEGKLFIIDHAGSNDIVRAMNLGTGREVWRFEYQDAARANYGFARSTPTFDNGKLYTLSREGNLHCLDACSGKPIWRKNIRVEFKGKKPGWDYSGSPVVDGEKLIVCPGGTAAAVVALNKTTGEVLWKCAGGDDVAGYATPVIATINGQKQYLTFAGQNLIGVAEDGRRLWSFAWTMKFGVNAADPVVVGDNAIFITSGYSKGCALVEVSGGQARAVWSNTQMQSHFSTPVYCQGYIYGTTDPGDLICLEPKTGKTLWRKAGFEKGGCVAVEGTLVVMNGKSGEVAQVSLTPAGYRELGRIKPLSGQCWTMPIVANGKLIVRNTSELICLDLKGK